MKRLWVLTIIAVATAASAGCHCMDWFNKGADCNPCPCGPEIGAPIITGSPVMEVTPGPASYGTRRGVIK